MDYAVLENSVKQEEFHTVRHGFDLGQHRFLVPELTFAELTSAEGICSIPDTPEWFCGFLNHRGDTVPVYDLAKLLGTELNTVHNQRWVLLIDEQPETIGVLVDQSPQAMVDPVVSDDVSHLPEIASQFVTGHWLAGGELWSEFDHRKFFSELRKFF